MVHPLPCIFVKFHKDKHKRNSCITQGIIKSITLRDRLYKKLKSTPRQSPKYFTIKTNLATFNFLGLTIDKQVDSKAKTDKIYSKISREIGILNRLKHFLFLHVKNKM